MKISALVALAVCAAMSCHAAAPQHATQLLCHRTANEDMPENTLESLEQAALLGCDVVEIDLRRTLDGEIVLNHDGQLERLTDGQGEVEQTNFAELELLDAGSWMAPRFSGMRIARFDDALRLARSLNIRLVLDIKTRGIGAEVLRILAREGMTDRVQFNGEWDDIKSMLPAATGVAYHASWLGAVVTPSDVAAIHAQGNAAIANFAAGSHEMDLDAMKAAVAAGVDAINVDYPRLGADAVGRPVEAKLRQLIDQANRGTDAERSMAVLALQRYQQPDLQSQFLGWLDSSLSMTSRAAALALLLNRPRVAVSQVTPVLRSSNAIARANAAWLLGMLHAPGTVLVPLLSDSDQNVQWQALLALSRATGDAPRAVIVTFFQSENAALRGAAALALAHLHPESAAADIVAQLHKEIANEESMRQSFRAGGARPGAPMQNAMSLFRCQMELMHALSGLTNVDAANALTQIAFQNLRRFAATDSILAGFQLWDRAGDNLEPIVQQLGSTNLQFADRAEWALVKADPRVLPSVRAALNSPESRRRAIRILAWHGDADALPALEAIARGSGPDKDAAAWAVEKIRLLRSSSN